MILKIINFTQLPRQRIFAHNVSLIRRKETNTVHLILLKIFGVSILFDLVCQNTLKYGGFAKFTELWNMNLKIIYCLYIIELILRAKIHEEILYETVSVTIVFQTLITCI